MQTTAGHAVAEVLAQLGVRKVTGVVGSCMLEVFDGMYGRDDIGFLSTRHEQAAALMADGYARVAGRPGVCIATNGPGATNLLTGVANAFHAQSPVLVITGAPMMKDMFRDSSQEIDQQALFRPVVKWSVQVRKPELAAAMTREAYERTTAGIPGPVHLDLPRDVLKRAGLRGRRPQGGQSRGARRRLCRSHPAGPDATRAGGRPVHSRRLPRTPAQGDREGGTVAASVSLSRRAHGPHQEPLIATLRSGRTG